MIDARWAEFAATLHTPLPLLGKVSYRRFIAGLHWLDTYYAARKAG